MLFIFKLLKDHRNEGKEQKCNKERDINGQGIGKSELCAYLTDGEYHRLGHKEDKAEDRPIVNQKEAENDTDEHKELNCRDKYTDGISGKINKGSHKRPPILKFPYSAENGLNILW